MSLRGRPAHLSACSAQSVQIGKGRATLNGRSQSGGKFKNHCCIIFFTVAFLDAFKIDASFFNVRSRVQEHEILRSVVSPLEPFGIEKIGLEGFGHCTDLESVLAWFGDVEGDGWMMAVLKNKVAS